MLVFVFFDQHAEHVHQRGERMIFVFANLIGDAVEQFHEAAMAGGGRDNGEPGLRPQYHENYYAAYVIDPDGNNIEAVSHTPG